MKHKLVHLFGWNKGQVVTFYVDNVLYIGFQCTECGEINHARRSIRHPLDLMREVVDAVKETYEN